MERRHLLTTIGVVGITGFAGCSGASDDETADDGVQDTDGDGVIDSEDYAPRDPDVQRESDVAEAGTAVAPTTTRTPPESSTPTPTPRSQVEDSVNVLRSEEESKALRQIIEYSAAEVTVKILGEAKITRNRGKPLAVVYGYPDGEEKAFGVEEPTDIPQNTDNTFTVSVDKGSIPREERLFYQTFFMPDDETYETVESSELIYLAPSDPFTISNSDRIERNHPDHLPNEDSTGNFERNDIEGSYSLNWSGQTDGRSWEIGFVAHKYAYSEAYSEPRGRDYDEYVAVAQNSGVAEAVAGYVNKDLEASGFTEPIPQVNATIDWAQSFPYVTDDVSRGYDEYPKLPAETLIDVSGDCEDTSILLASVLQASPFGYDMVLIGPPGHMAAGIYSSDRRGVYYTYDGRDYYYIETTGSGWGIGDLPETYEGTQATVYQV